MQQIKGIPIGFISVSQTDAAWSFVSSSQCFRQHARFSFTITSPTIPLFVLPHSFPFSPLFIASPPVFRRLRTIATTSAILAVINGSNARNRRSKHQSWSCSHDRSPKIAAESIPPHFPCVFYDSIVTTREAAEVCSATPTTSSPPTYTRAKPAAVASGGFCGTQSCGLLATFDAEPAVVDVRFIHLSYSC